MQALHDVVKAGYVRYIGMSSCYAYQCKSLVVLKCHHSTDDSTSVTAMQSELSNIRSILNSG